MIVYVATNKINGKKYIGYTTRSLNTRIQEHYAKSNYKNGKHYNYLFQRAIRKYTVTGFIWEILCVCSTKKECCIKEIELIKVYKTISPNGYNLTNGGDGGIQSNETKLKISTTLKKYYQNNPNKAKERINNMSLTNRSNLAKKAWVTKKIKGYTSTKGFIHSEDSKNLMSTTKNYKNKCKWINVITNEKIDLSLTNMAKYTNLSIGVFNHIKHKRQEKTKCGWKLYEEG